MASDARDILNESVPTPPPAIGQKKASKSKRKRPEGMNLELYSLLGSGNDPCPLVPTHASQGGYKVSFLCFTMIMLGFRPAHVYQIIKLVLGNGLNLKIRPVVMD